MSDPLGGCARQDDLREHVGLAEDQVVLRAEPHLRVVILNSYTSLQIEKLRPLSLAGRVYFDFAMVERAGAVARLAEQVTFPRVLFGSNYPLYYFESSLLKVQESGLTDAQATSVHEGSARRLLAR